MVKLLSVIDVFVAFAGITWPTKGLNIVDGVCPAKKNWQNMVNGQFDIGALAAKAAMTIEIQDRVPFFYG